MNVIAITGISGYIGSKLLSRLDEIESVEGIVGIDIRPPRDGSRKLKYYCRDVSEPLGDVFARNDVNSAIHLAFILKPTNDSRRARRVDIGGTLNFLEACGKARVKHIVYLSSHTVYGAHPDNAGPVNEESPMRPLSDFQYSADKAEVEGMLQEFAASHGDSCLTILRSCPVIGPNAAGSVATEVFKPVMIRVAGYDPPMQFVHENDLIELIVAILSQKKAGIFNVAGDEGIRYSEIIRLTGRTSITVPAKLLVLLIGFSWALRLQSESPISGLEFIKYPPIVSTEKLKNEIGFRFDYSSRDAIISFLSDRH